MLAEQMVDRVKRLKHRGVRYQRNVLQVGRLYMFRTYGEVGYCLRLMVAPVVFTVVLAGVILLLRDWEPLHFVAIFPVCVFAGWLFEQWMYHRMVSQGVDVYLDFPEKAFYQEPPLPNHAINIHRCGFPKDYPFD
ncbi:hypothetical protein [Alteromonas flava]|uniref:hypothetical protein n=1 Tax=Alteromonas flava TaxID=2048003 RepID=UPI000C286085|nr:hypothetical protein [Alteromonas flava]